MVIIGRNHDDNGEDIGPVHAGWAMVEGNLHFILRIAGKEAGHDGKFPDIFRSADFPRAGDIRLRIGPHGPVGGEHVELRIVGGGDFLRFVLGAGEVVFSVLANGREGEATRLED